MSKLIFVPKLSYFKFCKLVGSLTGHDRREVYVFVEVKNEEKWNFGHISKICKPIRLKFFKAMAIIVILMKS